MDNQSCQAGGGGLTNCGAGTESCCTSLAIEGGTYYRTYDPQASDGGVTLAADGGPAGEADPATVSSFRLDKYLVTVGRFRQFAGAVYPPDGGPAWVPIAGSGKHTHLNGGMGLANSGDAGAVYETGWVASDSANVAPTTANLNGGGFCAGTPYGTWTNAVGSQESLPINCVNWYEAFAFCIWDGGFLPSEAEWEYAAAGGSQQREYPWGSTDPGSNNRYAIYGDQLSTCHYPGNGACAGVQNIAPVGTATLGVGRWGQLDLAGEVWEWTQDWFATYVNPCVDCAYLTTGSTREYRGGGFPFSAQYMLPPARDANVPTARGFLVGFRCARAP